MYETSTPSGSSNLVGPGCTGFAGQADNLTALQFDTFRHLFSIIVLVCFDTDFFEKSLGHSTVILKFLPRVRH